MGFLLGVIGNVIANILFWMVLGVAFWLASTFTVQRFLRFFGLRRNPGVSIYLSNLWTPESSLSGRPEGYSISMHELWAAQSVTRLFGSAPMRLPELVRGLVDSLWLRKSVRCEISVSPLEAADADLSRTTIVLGGSVRNPVRARYVEMGLATAVIIDEEAP